jgi:hypothetical protein
MFTYFSETCCNSTIITDAHVVSRPHDHKSFDYEFCTLTSTLSNLNASCIYWIRLSYWMIFEYKTRDGKVNDCKWWSPCFVKVSTFVCQLEYNLYKWWWAGVSWILGFSCLSSRWNFTVISRLPSLFCDECPDRYNEQSGFCFCFCHVIASFIVLKIMQWIFGLRILVELIKCVG